MEITHYLKATAAATLEGTPLSGAAAHATPRPALPPIR